MSAEVCPVCGGRGLQPAGFYEPTPADGPDVTCRSCGGRGIVAGLSEGAAAASVDPLDLTYRPD